MRYKKPFVINGFEINDLLKEEQELKSEMEEMKMPKLSEMEALSSDEDKA